MLTILSIVKVSYHHLTTWSNKLLINVLSLSLSLSLSLLLICRIKYVLYCLIIRVLFYFHSKYLKNKQTLDING